MLGVNVPFRPARILALAALACLSLGQPGTASHAADNAQTSSFLKLTHDQRYWWIHGSVLTTSHLVATRDMKKGECVSGWYLKDKAGKQQLIENTITKYPSETPTTIVISLLTQACGELSAR